MRPLERIAQWGRGYGSALGLSTARRLALALGGLAVLAVLAASTAAAAAEAVLHVEGAASKRFTRDIAKALPVGMEETESRNVDVSLKKALRKNPLSRLEEAPSADSALVKTTRRALADSKADLAIVVVVGKARQIRVLVVPVDAEKSVFFRSVALPHFESAEEHVAWWGELFKEAIPNEEEEKATPPEPVEEKREPEQKPPERPKPKPAPRSTGVERADYFLSLAADLGLRQFSDNESGRGPARSYHAFPVPGFHFGAELYPILNGHLGVEAGYGMSVGVHSKASDGQIVGTSFLRAEGALKLRILTAERPRSPSVALLLGYGYSRFVFDTAPPNRELPTAVYQMLRAGLDGRAPIDRVVLSVGAEYDRLVSIRALGTVSPGSSGNGVTAHGGVGFEIVPGFFVRLDARYTWLLFALVRDIPSNVVDQYLTGSLAAELTF